MRLFLARLWYGKHYVMGYKALSWRDRPVNLTLAQSLSWDYGFIDRISE